MAEKRKANDIDVNVGRRIRLQRTVLGMSQTTLADALGITFQQVQKYEKGTNRVGASRLQHIASFLNVPIASFFEGMPAPVEIAQTGGAQAVPEANLVATFLGIPEGLALNLAFTKIADPTLRKKIIILVKSVAVGDDAEPESA